MWGTYSCGGSWQNHFVPQLNQHYGLLTLALLTHKCTRIGTEFNTDLSLLYTIRWLISTCFKDSASFYYATKRELWRYLTLKQWCLVNSHSFSLSKDIVIFSIQLTWKKKHVFILKQLQGHYILCWVWRWTNVEWAPAPCVIKIVISLECPFVR